VTGKPLEPTSGSMRRRGAMSSWVFTLAVSSFPFGGSRKDFVGTVQADGYEVCQSPERKESRIEPKRLSRTMPCRGYASGIDCDVPLQYGYVDKS